MGEGRLRTRQPPAAFVMPVLKPKHSKRSDSSSRFVLSHSTLRATYACAQGKSTQGHPQRCLPRQTAPPSTAECALHPLEHTDWAKPAQFVPE